MAASCAPLKTADDKSTVLSHRMIGLMSGTSLDGIDLCCADFAGSPADDTWTYRLIVAETIPYSSEWTEKLRQAPALSGEQLVQLHVDYGHLTGQTVRRFIEKHNLKNVSGIATHGHTVFHQPENKMTFQLGDGETIAAYVRCPVVSNFRSKDVALGGQGAPLVPVGEAHLFSQYQLCLNLGGIANLSVLSSLLPPEPEKELPPSTIKELRPKDPRLAFDICPCNMLLNNLALRLETGAKDFDDNGSAASEGKVIDSLLERLDSLDYYSKPPGPKSLGREWFEQNILPAVDASKSILFEEAQRRDFAVELNEFQVRILKVFPVRDLLRTAVEHIAHQIGRTVRATLLNNSWTRSSAALPSTSASTSHKAVSVLITGGGSHNRFLVERIGHHVNDSRVQFDSPPELVDFKEALVFAFLGVRRLVGLPNVARMVTGATADSVSGAVHFGNSVDEQL